MLHTVMVFLIGFSLMSHMAHTGGRSSDKAACQPLEGVINGNALRHNLFLKFCCLRRMVLYRQYIPTSEAIMVECFETCQVDSLWVDDFPRRPLIPAILSMSSHTSCQACKLANAFLSLGHELHTCLGIIDIRRV